MSMILKSLNPDFKLLNLLNSASEELQSTIESISHEFAIDGDFVEEYVSAIQAIIWESVFISGAGISSSGPILSPSA